MEEGDKMKKGVIGILGLVIVSIGGAISIVKIMDEKVSSWRKMSDKHLALFLMMNQWVKIKQEGKNLKDYFEKNGYRIIAIYGMSYAGETLIDELKNSDIIVKYGIDKNADAVYEDIDIVTMEENFEEVDAVIVTPITFFDEIQEELEKKINCPIVSLEDILYEV